MSHTSRPDAEARRRRTTLIVTIAIVGILAFAGGILVANLGGSDQAEPSPGVSTSATPSPTATVTSAAPTVPTSASPTTPAAPLPDGRHFGMLRQIQTAGDGSATLSFDLAYWYTDQKANEVAASRGDETPVPNGYYIVNDNPQIRKLAVAPGVDVRYVPENQCCDLQPGTLDGLEAAVNGTAMTDYPDPSYTYWWITMAGGEVVKIEQQWVP